MNKDIMTLEEAIYKYGNDALYRNNDVNINEIGIVKRNSEHAVYKYRFEEIRENISINDIGNLLNKYNQEYELLDERRIKLIDKGDRSYTIIEIADDNKSVTYEGLVIGGLKELEKRLWNRNLKSFLSDANYVILTLSKTDK